MAGLAGLAIVLVAGCNEDEEIRHYQVPKPEKIQIQLAAPEERQERLMVAILRHDNVTWFAKLMGPERDVNLHSEEFTRFVRSIQFTKDTFRPVTWNVPADWRFEPGVRERYATFRIGPKDAELELTVTHFEGQVGSLLANINRWRRQIGLLDIPESEVPAFSHEIQLDDGQKATVVDMVGPGGVGGMFGPFSQ